MTVVKRSLLARARVKAGGMVFASALNGMSYAGKLHPKARPSQHGVELVRDVPYTGSGERFHLLDVYKPQGFDGPRPAVLYIHGGAFRILSKDTHWMMGLAFARAGYTVLNVNYRLAPKHRFPAAFEDVCAAACWVKQHAHEYGADPDRLVLAGESAGGNLVTGLAVATSYQRPEIHARRVWDAEVRPRAVIAGCGILQVTRPERLLVRFPHMKPWIMDRILETSWGYLPDHDLSDDELVFADPLVFLERGLAPQRPLPPFFALVGTKDPLIDDTQRLARALDALSVPNVAKVYPGLPHAFHALVFLKAARKCWREQFRFLTPLVA